MVEKLAPNRGNDCGANIVADGANGTLAAVTVGKACASTLHSLLRPGLLVGDSSSRFLRVDSPDESYEGATNDGEQGSRDECQPESDRSNGLEIGNDEDEEKEESRGIDTD